MQILNNNLAALADGAHYDIAVIGAGGAGMAAALYAAIDGKTVLLVERTEYVGGTTARSAATTWVPGTHHSATVNPSDTLEDAARYLANAIGDRTPASLRQAFLDHGAQAVERIETHSEVKYRPYPKHPDYISELGGSTLSGFARQQDLKSGEGTRLDGEGVARPRMRGRGEVGARDRHRAAGAAEHHVARPGAVRERDQLRRDAA